MPRDLTWAAVAGQLRIVTFAAQREAEREPPAGAASPVNFPSTVDGVTLPTGAPPLAFEGFSVVGMAEHMKWIPGDPRWGVIHRERTYLFASEDEKQRFAQSPDRYAPVLSGIDIVVFLETGQQVDGSRNHGAYYPRDDGRLYLFSSEVSMAKFEQRASVYTNQLMQRLQEGDLAGALTGVSPGLDNGRRPDLPPGGAVGARSSE